MELHNMKNNIWQANLWESHEHRAQGSPLESDMTNCFFGSQGLIESNTEKFQLSFQEIYFGKQNAVSQFTELPLMSSIFPEDNHLVGFEVKPSAKSTNGVLPMTNDNSAATSPSCYDTIGFFDLLSEYSSTNVQSSDNTTSDDEHVWLPLPLDISVQVEAPHAQESRNHIPKIQKRIKKAVKSPEGDTMKSTRRNSANYAYYSNAGDSQKKKNRNLPGIFRDRFINKLYYIINKEKILSTTQQDVYRNYKKLAVKDADIQFLYSELSGLTDSDFADFMRFLQNYQQDLDEYKYFDMCRKYKGWHDIQADSSLESPNFYNYMKKVFQCRITEEAWSNYLLYTPKSDILNNLEQVIRSCDTADDFMFKNWKENKTWKKLRDLCTLDNYGNAPFFFWNLMEKHLTQNGHTQEDEVDREIFSELFLKEFRIEVSRYCQLKYYLKQKGE
jgi:hypothetical protein